MIKCYFQTSCSKTGQGCSTSLSRAALDRPAAESILVIRGPVIISGDQPISAYK